MWSIHPDCRKIIADTWNINVVGCPMFILTQKLKLVKDKLKTWNETCFGNVTDLVCSAELKLAHIQVQIQEHVHSDALLLEENLACTELEEALTKEEAFWQEKARLNWH
ncbi:hypothetical protein QL285_015474 [Trifolium repens]|nr:hypothetical protein QL285_015474 [Trifolium repens]